MSRILLEKGYTVHGIIRRASTFGTERIDVVTFYYMESDQEWQEITSSRGAFEALQEFKRDGRGLSG